jgi:hypothetical protein
MGQIGQEIFRQFVLGGVAGAALLDGFEWRFIPRM